MRPRLVTRRGCHLCEDAERALLEAGIDAELVDVDGDAELARLYDFRVPVLLDGEEVVLEGRITAEAAAKALGAGR